jgi:endonuclease YncB( thermonuclease family)
MMMMMRRRPGSLAASKAGMCSLLLFFLALCGPAVWVDVLEGRVVGVADGDTITLLDGNRQQHKICFVAIDS